MDSRAITAWVAAAMLLSQVSIGIFGVRRRILREPHIVLGLILPLLTFAHAWLSMKSVSMKSAALLLLGVQVLLGTALIRPSESSGSLKSVHLAVGLGILALASVHVLLIRKLEKGGGKMKSSFFAFVCLVTVVALAAAKRPDFAGSWEFNPGKSKNIGMMMQVKMADTIQQTDSALDETSHSIFQGNDQEMKTHYDLTGKPANNDSPMEGPSETVSKWDGNRLVTTWTSQSAVAGGPKVVRTETRSLSPDGNTMTIESVRDSNPPVGMVFDKKR